MKLRGTMLWIDCYKEEGILFRAIEVTGRLNKNLYSKGLISSTAYYTTKYKLMRLLIILEESYTTIYEVHSKHQN